MRIKKNSILEDINFYNIEEIQKNNKLSLHENKELFFSEKNETFQLWSFYQITDKKFVIKNKDNCYIIIRSEKVFCEPINLNKATQFKIIKIYTEVEKEEILNNYKLIDEEPIDVLIKYIDLQDPNLNRDRIHQIEKDYDNEELRYSIRSILKFIPWIRKIFILMPNEKVRYFKDDILIKEKIIYIKDKDLLGYDSSNSYAFQFRYWKLRKFGISNNIIVMDDDYFIGDKLEKNDFFHVENGKVIPSIITSIFLNINKTLIQKKHKILNSKVQKNKEEQNADVFNYSKYSTLLFLFNLFNITYDENIFIPSFTHNAIPVNLQDIKEIYDLTYKSKYKYATLDCKYRNIESLQFQMFITSYTFIKYKRKVNNIPYKYIEFKNAIFGNYNSSLFCINKGAGNFSYIKNYQSKIVMEYLFPVPSPYEIVDYSFLNISKNYLNSMREKTNLNKNRGYCGKSIYDYYFVKLNEILFLILMILKIKIDS